MIIIGAGIAGLSTGCYAQMNGFKSKIFEMHTKPGGVVTSWKRGSFIFDYAIHNLYGTDKGTNMYKVWKELGALEGTEFINHDVHVRVESPNGKALNVYTNLDKLEAHLKEIAPEDSGLITETMKNIRKLGEVDFLSMGLQKGNQQEILAPYMPLIAKYGRMMLADFADKFQNPFLREALKHIQHNLNAKEVPLLVVIFFLSALNKGDLGWPRGGSLEFSKKIAKKYLELGGEIQYRSTVEKIIEKDGKAVGVKLKDGNEQFADIIISAADGHSTIYKMLNGKHTNELIDTYYDAVKNVDEQQFGLEINFGLNRDLTNEPHAIVLLLDKPERFDVNERNSLFLELFDENTGLTKKGKSILKAVTLGNYPYWKNLRQNYTLYREQKQKVADKVIDIIEKRFPKIKDQIEITDVTTPVTAERFTNNYRGWQPGPHPTKPQEVLQNGLSITLPGLDDFFMVGHWAAGKVGINTVALMGRNLIKRIKQGQGKELVSEIPAL